MRGHESPKRRFPRGGHSGEEAFPDWDTVEKLCEADGIPPYQPIRKFTKLREKKE